MGNENFFGGTWPAIKMRDRIIFTRAWIANDLRVRNLQDLPDALTAVLHMYCRKYNTKFREYLVSKRVVPEIRNMRPTNQR